jgi:hypothetical protein
VGTVGVSTSDAAVLDKDWQLLRFISIAPLDRTAARCGASWRFVPPISQRAF